MTQQVNYGNWIRKKNLVILGTITLVCGVLILLPFGVYYKIILSIIFSILLISFLFPFYSFVMFSQHGGRYQEKIYDLIISSLGQNISGNILDIGTGNGVLAIKLALYQPNAQIEGIDYWGSNWEYSKRICEKNAQTAGVDKRIRFNKGDAAKLNYADNIFDCAISNLTFHEVQSVADKREVLHEALRIVKPEGKFAFIDYFYDTKYYGKTSEFEEYLFSLGLKEIEIKPLYLIINIPFLLRHPKIFGKVGIVRGKK